MDRRILVVEDDPAVREAVERALRYEGYLVETAADGARAVDLVEADPPDVVVLDLMMPVLDGLEACRLLRARGHDVPILVLTALADVGDRVAGLDAGADDYLVKPFALEELLARIRALLRRADGAVTEVLRVADLVMDVAARRVTRDGEELHLTKTEFELLERLLRSAGRVVEREALYRDIWGIDFETTSNPLDVYVGYLRRKTEAGGRPRLVHTVRGVGYVVREP
ncbi:MAG TPA: response regulator transcription factor [Actinobacteria bacterium]|nr:response regulator transcription factor [Actinomycetota bacterium]